MSRTIRYWYKIDWCHKCDTRYAHTPKLIDGYCKEHTRVLPWFRQHDKKVRTRRRNKYKNSKCCGSQILWVNDLFWYYQDVKDNDIV